MRKPILCVAAVAALAVAAACQAAIAAGGTPATSNGAPEQAAPRPEETPAIATMLRAMSNSSTWGHPDLYGQFSGMRAYYLGRYGDAMRSFRFGARYSDKLSQAMIGLMYADGRGVASNPATACAWLELAADRNYPEFKRYRDHYCGTLDHAERTQAATTLATLQSEYGDAVAMRRLSVAMRLALTQRTGSHIGFDSNARIVIDPMAGGFCDRTLVVAGVVLPPSDANCPKPTLWNPALRDPDTYFAMRDWQYRGTVTVGEPQDLHQPTTDDSGTQGHDTH